MAQLVREVMTSDPAALSSALSVRDAAMVMRERGIGNVLVFDENEQLCGIVTDRDIVVRAVADDLTPSSVQLASICSAELLTVDAGSPVSDAVVMMRTNALRRLPVIENGRPIGIISLGDLALDQDTDSVLAGISAAPSNI
jgi:signal-transduction protein with cAMP-binding, CBS, and nucleotidyltransferase domain